MLFKEGENMIPKIVREFEEAVREYEIVGSKDPEEWDEIRKNYLKAKKNLVSYVIEMRRKERKGVWFNLVKVGLK